MSDTGYKEIIKRKSQKSTLDSLIDGVDDVLENTYKAFKVGLNGKMELMLAFNFKDKSSEAFYYFNIDGFKFEENNISIIKTQQIFTLKGKNLDSMKQYFIDNRIQHLYEFDPAIFGDKPENNEPLIEEIIITDIKKDKEFSPDVEI